MKLTGVLAILVLVTSCEKDDGVNADMPCVSDSFSGDVMAFYPFSEGSLSDKSGHNRHLENTTSAIPGEDRFGNPNCAYYFDNSDSLSAYLSRGDASFMNSLDAFSISLWYKAESDGDDGGKYQTLIGRNSSEGIQVPDRMGEWTLGLYDCKRPVFGASSSVWDDMSFDPGTTCADIMEMYTGSWNHLVITYRIEGTDQMKLYLNGNHESTDIGGEYSVEDIGDLFVGYEFTGFIDDIILFDRVLSLSEVKDLYDMVPCCD